MIIFSFNAFPYKSVIPELRITLYFVDVVKFSEGLIVNTLLLYVMVFVISLSEPSINNEILLVWFFISLLNVKFILAFVDTSTSSWEGVLDLISGEIWSLIQIKL